ncbi:MAG TPA: hypothetical protein VLD55_13605 [Candidatus Sulfobium mesophilum]|nr:hypothetical protein [Candidatus Sulfobium mesophilum]
MGRRLLIVLLLSLAVVWIHACGGQGGAGNTGGTTSSTSSPELAITGLTTAIQNGDISGALSYVGNASSAKIGSALQRMDASSRLRLAAAILSAHKVSESKNRIVYMGTILLPGGQAIEESFEIITEGGVWKFFSL